MRREIRNHTYTTNKRDMEIELIKQVLRRFEFANLGSEAALQQIAEAVVKKLSERKRKPPTCSA